MAIIIIRGRREPIECHYDVAKRIKADWGNVSIPQSQIMEVGEATFTKGDLKIVDLANNENQKSEDIKDKGVKQREEDNLDYMRDRNEIAGQTPENRAERIEMFRLLCWAHGMVPTNEQESEAKRIATKFFAANPRRIRCDPKYWKHLMPEKESGVAEWADGAMRAVEGAVAKDHEIAVTQVEIDISKILPQAKPARAFDKIPSSEPKNAPNGQIYKNTAIPDEDLVVPL